MGVGTALRALGRFLDECEERDVVSRVDISGSDDAEATVAATLELVVDTCAPPEESGFSPGGATVESDGTLTVALESREPLLPADDHDVDVEPTRTTRTSDGATVVELRATVPTGASVDRDDTAAAGSTAEVDVDESHVSVTPGGAGSPSGSESDAGVTTDTAPASRRSRDVPPFRDTELLREVYETCDTFSEMPKALGMDVTPETVRRYMIRQGIHEPTSYNTGSDDTDEGTDERDTGDEHGAKDETEMDETEMDDANVDDTDVGDAGIDNTDVSGTEVDDTEIDDELESDEAPAPPSEELESPAVLADGIGLPDDVAIDTIVEAVQTSNTIYEVKQGIGIEREDALEMLRELNLLEFVAGRLATEAEREVSRDQIIDRLRQQADSL